MRPDMLADGCRATLVPVGIRGVAVTGAVTWCWTGAVADAAIWPLVDSDTEVSNCGGGRVPRAAGGWECM